MRPLQAKKDVIFGLCFVEGEDRVQVWVPEDETELDLVDQADAVARPLIELDALSALSLDY